MLHLKSNFRPVEEPKNGHIGYANLTVGHGLCINNISVFQNGDNYSIQFAPYHDDESLIKPHSPEAHAAILGVVVKAVNAESHFAYENGDNLRFADFEDKKRNVQITGTRVKEPYADGRYTLVVDGLLRVQGITTNWVEYEKDGKKRNFAAVNMPTVKDADGKVRMYTNAAGEKVAALEVTGVTHTWKDKDGNEHSIDYAEKIANAIRKERSQLYHASLDNQVNDAKEKGKATKAKAKEPAKKEKAAPKKATKKKRDDEAR